MWPSDIEALQAKLHDVKDGRRPYFFHEVIDLGQNGEIAVNEYFGVGATTEFRYCIKIKQCAAEGFYNCPGVYDQVSEIQHCIPVKLMNSPQKTCHFSMHFLMSFVMRQTSCNRDKKPDKNSYKIKKRKSLFLGLGYE